MKMKISYLQQIIFKTKYEFVRDSPQTNLTENEVTRWKKLKLLGKNQIKIKTKLSHHIK